jgi:hypothetical protein
MFFETADDGGIVRVAGAAARIDDDVDRGKVMLMQPERFPDEALDSIAADRASDDSGGDGQSKSSSASAVRSREDGEHGIGGTSRILVDAIEVRLIVETVRRGKWPGRCLQEQLRTAWRRGGVRQ